MVVVQHPSMLDFKQKQWDELAINAGPFLQYQFLLALELSGSINNNEVTNTGWQAQHLAVYDEDKQLIAAVPGYLKTHSYGEYVFDHSWANAYHQYGIEYFPKWIAAIPFTPVTGPRLLCNEKNVNAVTEALFAYTQQNTQISSQHWLFVPQTLQNSLQQQALLARYSVQFQWHNRGYSCFDDFLGMFKSRKRKDLRKERVKAQRDISIQRLTGQAITPQIQQDFYLCYQQTYLKRSGHNGYLTKAFFDQLFTNMLDNVLIVIANQGNQILGSALFLYDHTGLYGRYWGSLQDKDSLHFECCYYQGIEFAIENTLPVFNPGTQGEHKLLRGFEPVICRSCHWLNDKRFHAAVDDFLQKEKRDIQSYYDSAFAALPFNENALQQCKRSEF